MSRLLENSGEYRDKQLSTNEYDTSNLDIIFVDGKEYNIEEFLQEKHLVVNDYHVRTNDYENNPSNSLDQINVNNQEYDIDEYVNEKILKSNEYHIQSNEYDNSDGINSNSILVNGQEYDVEEFRNNILKRNIYTPNEEYEINNPIIDSIDSISEELLPFIKTTGLSSELGSINRLYASITNQTKLVQIGKQKLGDQLLKTITSNISKSVSEKVNLTNLTKKDKSIFENRDYNITKRNTLGVIDDITGNAFGIFTSNLGGLVSGLVENLINNPLDKNFDQESYLNGTRDEFILNNTGKGQVENIKTNIENNQYVLTYIQDNIEDFNNNPVINNKIYFSETDWIISPEKGDERMYPNNYPNIYTSDDLENYGVTNDFKKTEDWDDTNYINDDYNDEFVWGKNINKFGINRGLLQYTNALMNASDNNIIDTNKKKFHNPRNKNKFDGYNGAGIHDIPEEALGDHLKDGIRQHNLSDQYDKYAKAIRFNGNRIYGGNKNTTNYDIVKPKIHPTIDDDNNVNNRNMMFSIENLAVNIDRVDEDKQLCYLNDEFDTPLPLSEKGPFNGRIMWFPPYDLKLMEDVSNDIKTTKFIGRGEPVYTYNNTERSATISFKLLIDTPPQLREITDKNNFHRKASEFFLFGGNYDNTINRLSELESELNGVNIELQNYDENEEVIVPPFQEQEINVYFDNDSDQIIETYEDDITDPSIGEVEDYGLNLRFFDLINEFVEENFIEENQNIININLIGNSSKLYYDSEKEAGYNKKLSQRRINNVVNYINNIYGGDIRADFDVIENPLGSENAEEANDPSILHSRDVKEERSVKIELTQKSVTDIINVGLTTEKQKEKIELLDRKDEIEGELSRLRQKLKQINTNEFQRIDINNNFLKGFDGPKDNILQPCFYSQTPENFHRRLTFLQQCMRQGKNIEGGDNTNSVFGRQPISVLRIGDFFYTKIIIENLNFDYSVDVPWDLNPEGMGVQPMLVDVSMKVKVIGGQSLATPISTLQNALAFNYYANSTYYNGGTYSKPSNMESEQLDRNNDEN